MVEILLKHNANVNDTVLVGYKFRSAIDLGKYINKFRKLKFQLFNYY